MAIVLLALVLAAAGLAGCGGQTASQANATETRADGLPVGFPDAVPTPGGPARLTEARKVAGVFTLRYDVDDPRAALTAYTSQLLAAGFKVIDRFDDLGGATMSMGVRAAGRGQAVNAVAFGSADGDHREGNSMGITVEAARTD